MWLPRAAQSALSGISAYAGPLSPPVTFFASCSSGILRSRSGGHNQYSESLDTPATGICGPFIGNPQDAKCCETVAAAGTQFSRCRHSHLLPPRRGVRGDLFCCQSVNPHLRNFPYPEFPRPYRKFSEILKSARPAYPQSQNFSAGSGYGGQGSAGPEGAPNAARGTPGGVSTRYWLCRLDDSTYLQYCEEAIQVRACR